MSVSVTRFPVLADSLAALILSALAISQRNRNNFLHSWLWLKILLRRRENLYLYPFVHYLFLLLLYLLHHLLKIVWIIFKGIYIWFRFYHPNTSAINAFISCIAALSRFNSWTIAPSINTSTECNTLTYLSFKNTKRLFFEER